MESCGMSMVKYLLFAFNIIFCITGLLLIVFGSIVLSSATSTIQIAEDDPTYVASIILIVAGIVIFVIAFLGCFGAIRESYGMLMTFAVFLLIIFIVELAIGITVAVNKEQLNLKTFRDTFNKDLEKDKEKWDTIQSKFMCCGVEGPTDYGGTYPKSCCTSEKQGSDGPDALCPPDAPGMTFAYKEGCFSKLQTALDQGKKILMGIGIGIAFVEIVGIILACWLAAVIKREQNEPKD